VGCFGLFAFGIEFEVGLELGDGFVFLFHFLRDLAQREVGEGVVGLDFNCVFRAEVGTGQVVIVHVELRDGDVLVDALIVGLDFFDLGELAVDGGSFGAGREVGCAAVVVGAGAGRTGAAAGTAAPGVIAGKQRGLLGWEGVVRGRGGGGGFGAGGRAGSVGRGCRFCGFAGKWERFGGGRRCVGRRRWAGFGCCLVRGPAGWGRRRRRRRGCVGRTLRRGALGKTGRGEEKSCQERAGCGANCHLFQSTRSIL